MNEHDEQVAPDEQFTGDEQHTPSGDAQSTPEPNVDRPEPVADANELDDLEDAPADAVADSEAEEPEAITDLDDMLTKLNSYSTWGAQTLHERGRRAGLGTARRHRAWTVVKTYVLRAGFLDGREGFMLAVSNAEGAYYKYLKLMLLARREKSRS